MLRTTVGIAMRRGLIASSMLTASSVWAQTATPPTASTAPQTVPQPTTAPTGALTAQEGAEQPAAGITDIIVTAERREESVQRAPLTIQVLSNDDLVKGGVTDTQSLQRVTNGVQIGSNGANSQIFVRGVGTFSAGVATSPGVSFNVDGVTVNQTFGSNGNFYDLARVEVLKGPQGTLYGRNATGGAINLITNAPVLGRRSLDLTLEAGNYQLAHATGAVNLPIGETAAVRAAFNVVQRNGYLSDGQNDDIEQSGRLRFKWEPTTDVTLLLNGDYTHLGGYGGDYVYLPSRPGSNPYESETTAANNAYLHSFQPLGPLLINATPQTQNVNLYNASAQLDYKLPFATLTVLPAYRHMKVDFGFNFTGSLHNDSTVEQKSVEARLGNSGPRLTWVVGGFYFDENVDNLTQTRASNIINLANQNILEFPNTKSYAFFGQTTVSPVDRFRVIGGLRYTHEDRLISGTNTNSLTGLLAETFSGQRSFQNVSYKVGAEFDIARRSMLYATYSTGYKSGGFSAVAAPNTYEPERLYATEAGSKNRFFDNKLQLNLSGFYWKYKNIQDSRPGFSGQGNLSLITFNSGNATLYGATLEIVAQPTRNDTLRLSGEYAHSRYDTFSYLTPAPVFNPASSGCRTSGPYLPGAALPTPANGSSVNNLVSPAYVSDCSGFQVARVPEWSGTASYAHTFDLGGSGKVTIDGSVNYASARWTTIDFIAPERDGAYALLDANLTYTDPNNKYSVSLFGRNLTKTVYYSGAIQSLAVPGLVPSNINAPRTYGVRLQYRFGD